jgi:predicted secreted protein
MNIRVWLVCITSFITCSLLGIYKEPITTRQGHYFTVKIPSTQIAGIDWFFGNEKELNDYVQLRKSEFVSQSTINNGRIGKKIFVFKAIKPGKIIIKMIKCKSWENKELDHKLIKVFIKEADYGQGQNNTNNLNA